VRRLKVLITVKTYPIPSAKYDELSCTAGVTEEGDFVRLYPINYRDLPWSQQFKKYQWIEVMAGRHSGRDFRKESWRPDSSTVKLLGQAIPTGRGGDWSERGRYVLRKVARSMEDLRDRQEEDNTSIGIFRPRDVVDMIVSPAPPQWKTSFLNELRQARLWETRQNTREPPRKIPWRFQYRFRCDDPRCNGHKMTNEDWEVGALYWRLVDDGASPREAASKVKRKFLDEICSESNETYFFVGTVLKYARSWVVIGTFYPKKGKSGSPIGRTAALFAD
jgi:hypothetical protein